MHILYQQRMMLSFLKPGLKIADLTIIILFILNESILSFFSQMLKRQEYFGKYGKIMKVVINNNTAYAGTQVSSPIGLKSMHIAQL